MSSSTSLTPSDPVIYRPPSACSLASNSSAASGVSLTRRSEIRARSRSRTLAGNGPTNRPPKSPKTPQTDLPFLDKPCVQEPSPSRPHGKFLQPPEHVLPDTHDLRGKASGSLQGSEAAALDATIVVDGQPSPLATKLSKGTERASSLPDIVTNYNQPGSTFFKEPCLTPVANVRDSVSTQQSGTYSSIYPLSISTTSGPDSPTSLCTMSEDIEHFEVSSFEPEVEELPGFDPDDVSYRLRLLVKNNYFLPPAHSKPSLSDFAVTDTSKKPSRAMTPTFLDIFRVTKSKSKPTTPVIPSIDPNLPMLRATGDSIMAPHVPQPRSSYQIPRTSPGPMPRERTGRVVVVREKVEDLGLAAKQAEQEIKSRGIRRDLDSTNLQLILHDVIDPTDAVDLPLPSSSYPFAVQASALHGLGVDESVGAAVLAERLPPPQSPQSSSSYDMDDDWRKALLHEAVHHSLDNSVDLSSFSQVLGLSTPVASPKANGIHQVDEIENTPPNVPRILLQQRIVEQPFLDSTHSFRDEERKQEEATANRPSLSKNPTGGPQGYTSLGSRTSSRPSSYLPARVETPSNLMTPLKPPPPRKHINAPFSQSQTHLPANTVTIRRGGVTDQRLRKAMSSPMLSDSYESSERRVRMTPPPMPPAPTLCSQDSSRDLASSNNASRSVVAFSAARSESVVFSDDEEVGGDVVGRSSAALSAMMSRPSLSEYSQSSMSPTTSAFQYDLNNAHPPTSSAQNLPHLNRPNSRDSPVPRYSTMSPPPRISSSLVHVALPPPPRAFALHHQPLQMRLATVHSQQRAPASLDAQVEAATPEPTTPPVLLSARRGNRSPKPLTLQIPADANVEVAIHSAPAPSSPTSFFDNIQSQPNAMDDLDSSSDESDEEENTTHGSMYGDARARAMSTVSSTTRPTLMRLGNHSTPYFSRSTTLFKERPAPLPFGVQDPKQPIVNVPKRAPFFVQQRSGKGDSKNDQPASSFDFYKYAQQHSSGHSSDLGGPPRRPATADQTRHKASQINARARESLQRLDGLLQQHMEAEKDTIKRIASTLQSSKDAQWTQTHKFKG
ncbi:hypothetical protein AX17_007415 [Amanita inopinata Kibby_2008]|nr:hypothetical protein AX17_007415 [Amanita inopinata Kibby_2008]